MPNLSTKDECTEISLHFQPSFLQRKPFSYFGLAIFAIESDGFEGDEIDRSITNNRRCIVLFTEESSNKKRLK